MHASEPHDREQLVVRCASPHETRAVAAALGAVLVAGDVVLLAGDLGAGKTTFAQAVAERLGVREPVTSPTFALVRPYSCAPPPSTEGAAVTTLLHADVYRLERLAEVADLALDEQLEEGAVALVEWGELAAPVLGPGALTVRIESPGVVADGSGLVTGRQAGDEERAITFSGAAEAWGPRIRRVGDLVRSAGIAGG